jgi:hypothetical protein
VKRLFLLALAIAALSITSVAVSATGGKLKCFADAPATCHLNGDGTATLTVPAGADAGVYYTNGKNTSGSLPANVNYTFQYTCTSSANCLAGGSPRLSIPIDSTGDGKTDGYAFIDALGCGYTNDTGLQTVSTTLANCQVTYQGVTYANWDAFATANPAYTVGNNLPFVIADQPFEGIIFSFTATKS